MRLVSSVSITPRATMRERERERERENDDDDDDDTLLHKDVTNDMFRLICWKAISYDGVATKSGVTIHIKLRPSLRHPPVVPSSVAGFGVWRVVLDSLSEEDKVYLNCSENVRGEKRERERERERVN